MPLPTLRWPHDRHRGLRTRLLAQLYATIRGLPHQDRYVMSTRPALDNTITHPFRWRSVGIATARADYAKSRLSPLRNRSIPSANRRPQTREGQNPPPTRSCRPTPPDPSTPLIRSAPPQSP